MILFGLKNRTKEYGPSFYHHCPACNQPAYHELTKARRWLTVYFVPLLPFERADHYATCQHCGMTEAIEDAQEVKRYKQAAALTRDRLNDDIGADEYGPRMRELVDASKRLDIEESPQSANQPLQGYE